MFPSSISLRMSRLTASRDGSDSYAPVVFTYTSSPQYWANFLPGGGSSGNPRCLNPTMMSATCRPESST